MQLLGLLGLTHVQQQVYLELIGSSNGTAEQVVTRIAARSAVDGEPVTFGADSSRVPGVEDVRAAFLVLQEHGLVRVDSDQAEAAAPDLAVDSLLLGRMHELQAARVELRDWAARQQPVRHGNETAQIVVGAAAITQTFHTMQRSAREEMLGFERPPYTANEYQNLTEMELLGRGVRVRIVYDRLTLERPNTFTQISRFIAAGEEARVATSVPGKLAVMDRRSALLSLPTGADPGEPWAFVVRGTAWVEVLVALFTEVWERGTPLRVAPADDGGTDQDRWSVPTATDRWMLSLLMTGLPDKAIASQLGMSLRTVQRRLRQLMDLTGSATRMQLGWYVARNDWL
jgi:hypothetical protein